MSVESAEVGRKASQSAENVPAPIMKLKTVRKYLQDTNVHIVMANMKLETRTVRYSGINWRR